MSDYSVHTGPDGLPHLYDPNGGDLGPTTDGGSYTVHITPGPSNPTLSPGGGTSASPYPGFNPQQGGQGFDPYTVPQPQPADVPATQPAIVPAPDSASPSPAPDSGSTSGTPGGQGASGGGWAALSAEIATRGFVLLLGVVLLIVALVWAMRHDV